jgi:DNA mismatch repair protein MutS
MKVSRDRNYCRPTILETQGHSGFQVEGLRHPLLESIQTRVEYVKHDISLGFSDTDDKGRLLYGMNASGKSSLMKAIGIAVLLAQAGCYVPATKFSLYPFKSLLTRILNQDNIWAGLSSFAVEMSELRDIFSRAESHSLVLGDELCSGTESVSATSLVAAGIQYLLKQGTRFVFATHLHGLQKLDQFEGVGVWHLRCHYDPVTCKLIYDRTLHPGAGTTMYGIEVARAMHIPIEIIQQAFTYRRMLEGETSVQEASQSQWNSNMVLYKCERCGAMTKDKLEVHHIQHRSTADNSGRLPDGSHQNNLKNLIVLCEKCHREHHAGQFDVGPVKQTSEGEVRTFSETVSIGSGSPQKDDSTAMIERYIRENPNIPLKILANQIRVQEGVQVSEQKIRSVRKKMN